MKTEELVKPLSGLPYTKTLNVSHYPRIENPNEFSKQTVMKFPFGCFYMYGDRCILRFTPEK